MPASVESLTGHLVEAMDALGDAVALFGADNRLLFCNEAYRKLRADPFIAGLARWWHSSGPAPRMAEPASSESSESARGDGAAEAPFEVHTRSGRRLRVEDRRTRRSGFVRLVRDVSAESRKVSLLEAAQERAEADSRKKGEFLSALSHELRTPLNAMLGFAQLMERDHKDPLPGRHRARLEQLLECGEHLQRLIEDILDLSRIDAGTLAIVLEPVDVVSLLDEVVAALAPDAMRAGVVVDARFRSWHAPAVSVDRARFRQILMSYGSNAIKYNRCGGTVEFSFSLSGGMLRIAVSDDGLGIPPEHQPAVFQPFHRAGQEAGPIAGKGTGLGLSKQLAELMGGGVGFSSVHGKGSTFWVEVPVYRTHLRSGLPPDPDSCSEAGSPEHDSQARFAG